MSTEFNAYTKAHFDVKGVFNNFVNCDNPSVLSRFGNLLFQGIHGANSTRVLKSAAAPVTGQQTLLPLPKIIVVIPDMDIVKCFKHDHDCTTKTIGRVLNFIMTEHEWAIASFKEFLPAKSVTNDYPQILWIQAPEHINFPDNSQRFKFNRSLSDAAKLHSNVTTLVLKKAWDPKDQDLFLSDSSRFTIRGYNTYWEAVDCTIRYFDSIMLKKQFKGKTQKSSSAKSDQKDRFRWQNPSLNVDRDAPTSTYCTLPEPPPRQVFL